MALIDVLSSTPNTPYARLPPLHILAVEIIEQPRVASWNFSENTATARVTKLNKVVAITDGKSVTKFTLFEELSHKVKEGMSYIIKNYNVWGQSPPLHISITHRALFFRASAITPPEELIQAAKDLLHPNATLTSLSSVQEQQGFVTVQGEVIEISAMRKVLSGKEEVPFRNIALKQEKSQVSVSLWREAAVYDVPLGAVLTVTHTKVARAEYGVRLMSTNLTKMEVHVSDNLNRVEVVGIMDATEDEGMMTVLLADGTELEISQKLWNPLDDLLKVDKVTVNIQKLGNRITAIKPLQDQK